MSDDANKTLLFLCTGNYYRSRFAEVLFNSLAGKAKLPWMASSRGLALERGVYNVGPMARSAVKLLTEMGVPPGDYFSRSPLPVNSGDFSAAHKVIALKHAEHYPLMLDRFPTWADRIDYWHIEDEPGVLPLLDREIRQLATQLMER